MPKIALYRPAISQPCGIGEVGRMRVSGGGGGRADPSRFSKKYLSPPCLRLDQSCWWDMGMNLGGGGGGGRGGNSLYMTWYGCAARIAPFFSAARYMISPLFPRKLYMTDPFFLEWYMNGPIFLHPCLNVHNFAKIFSSETQI